MSWVRTALEAIAALTGLTTATTRLVEAAKASEPPPPEPEAPPPLGSGAPDALSYMRGRNDEQHRQAQRERQQRSAKRLHEQAAEGEPGEAEQPSDGGTPP
jgi:hypothetical protein